MELAATTSMVRTRSVRFAGLEAIELRDDATEIVIVHEIGPRIASVRHGSSENLLYWDHAGERHRGEWKLYGGHRLWTTRPLADESEECHAPDNERCQVREVENGIAVTAPPTAWGIEKTIVVQRSREGVWRVEHQLRNASDLLWSGGAWALTATRPLRGSRYRIPLGGSSPRWDVVTIVVSRRWAGHTSRLVDPQFEMTEEAIEVRALGVEAKRMMFAPRGTIEMRDERALFIKTAARRDGAYPLNTNLAVYLAPDAWMVEIESMSPITTLAPDQVLSHVEEWCVSDGRALTST